MTRHDMHVLREVLFAGLAIASRQPLSDEAETAMLAIMARWESDEMRNAIYHACAAILREGGQLSISKARRAVAEDQRTRWVS